MKHLGCVQLTLFSESLFLFWNTQNIVQKIYSMGKSIAIIFFIFMFFTIQHYLHYNTYMYITYITILTLRYLHYLQYNTEYNVQYNTNMLTVHKGTILQSNWHDKNYTNVKLNW